MNLEKRLQAFHLAIHRKIPKWESLWNKETAKIGHSMIRKLLQI
jgi:hypothetical protein